jgi:4-methylaminobutanoate oxidase (formaldehyde-forming)
MTTGRSESLPDKARVVVIGGGIIGASVLYHLAKAGVSDALLLERDRFASGTTWHAAGIVGQLRESKAQTELAQYTTALFRSLEAETGLATGYRENGSMSVALTPQRLEAIRRNVSAAQRMGIVARFLDRDEIHALWPLMRVDDVLGGQFVPSNGQVNPLDVTNALIKGARQAGAVAIENLPVQDLMISGGKVVGVRTASGDIACDRVVLAGGLWTHRFAKRVGIPVPLHAAEHFYIVTEAIPGLARSTPVLTVADERLYFKEDAGKLLIGGFEARGKAWPPAGEAIPAAFSFQDLPPDLDHMEPLLTLAAARLPILDEVGVKLFFCGPESFTPDGRAYLGPAADVRGIFIAAGFNSNGILNSGGAGKVMAEWVLKDLPPVSMGTLHAQRALDFQSNSRYLRDRVVESIGMHMTLHWPGSQVETARGVRHFPLHDRLLAAGAVMGERIGWEFPLYFDSPGARLPEQPGFGYQPWFPLVEAECLAARDAALFVDQSCYAKLLVSGPDAVRLLNWVCANDVDVPVGTSVYSHFLNARGGIEADVTLTRIASEEFLVITGHPSQVRDRAWIRAQIDPAWRVQCHDVTASYAMFALSGPRAREILAAVTDADVSNEAFPFGAARLVDVGYARVWVLRRSFVGELGFEFYPTTDCSRHVYEALWTAGSPFGMRHGGFLAVNHCRVEKGFVHFGHDVGEDDTPLEAGLAFAVALDKAADFIGKDALLRQRAGGPTESRLVNVRLKAATLESGPYLLRNEPLWCGQAIVGYVTSGAWGFRLGGSFGLGSVRNPAGVTAGWLAANTFDVEVAGVRHPVELRLGGYYDPKGQRLRG